MVRRRRAGARYNVVMRATHTKAEVTYTKTMTRLAAVAVVCWLPWAGGCSTFNRDWDALTAEPVPTDDMTGRWQGTWTSDANGHTGTLRCIMTKLADAQYRARFFATYADVLTFGYTVDLAASDEGGKKHFEGEADLGWLAGGMYKYQGTADATTFNFAYESKDDHGVFQMKRPPPP